MKSILVALDASPNAAPVLDYARDLAQRVGAKLVLFRAVQVPVDFPAQAFTIAPSQLTPLLLEQAREGLQKHAARCPPGMVERIETDLGTPWRAVCKFAEEAGVDLVVIGSHAYGGIDRLLGTTAARIVNHADLPVLVVRHPKEHPV